MSIAFGWMPFFIKACRNSTKFLGIANAFSGGIFFGIGLFHLLPEGTDKIQKTPMFNEIPLSYFLAFIAYSGILYVEKVAFDNHDIIEEGSGKQERDIEKNIPSFQPWYEQNESSMDMTSKNADANWPWIHSGMRKRQSSFANDEEAIKSIITAKGRWASFLIVSNSNAGASNLESYLDKRNQSVILQGSPADKKRTLSDYTEQKRSLNTNMGINPETNAMDKVQRNEQSLDKSNNKANETKKKNPFTAYILLMALGLHSIFEGIALGIQGDMEGTLFLLLAIVAHKWAESLTLGISFVKANSSKCSFVAMNMLFSFIGPLGIIIGIILSEQSNELVEGIFLSISTGTFIYVACSEVIIEEFSVPTYKYSKFLMYNWGGVLTAGICFLEYFTNDKKK